MEQWGCGQDAIKAALDLEKTVNQALLDLHKVADKHRDFHMGAVIWCDLDTVWLPHLPLAGVGSPYILLHLPVSILHFPH